jgi:hypothetical protein
MDDGTVLVPLRARDGSVRANAIIDAADAARVNQWRWFLTANRYAARKAWVDGRYKMVYLHRELLGLIHGDELETDHANRDTLDNRRANLRLATRSQNCQNVGSRGDATSTHRGVSWDKSRGKWLAQLEVNGRKVPLGRFIDEGEAAAAARDARARLMPRATD